MKRSIAVVLGLWLAIMIWFFGSGGGTLYFNTGKAAGNMAFQTLSAPVKTNVERVSRIQVSLEQKPTVTMTASPTATKPANTPVPACNLQKGLVQTVTGIYMGKTVTVAGLVEEITSTGTVTLEAYAQHLSILNAICVYTNSGD
jgi:hypothetical protein